MVHISHFKHIHILVVSLTCSFNLCTFDFTFGIGVALTVLPVVYTHCTFEQDGFYSVVTELISSGFTRGIGMFLTHLTAWKEGNVLFTDALNTFIYGFLASDIW